MKKTMQLMMVGTLMGAMVGYGNVLMSEDFETGQTVGSAPTGATIVRPNPETADAYVRIVDSASNPAGTGNGAQFKDSDSATGTMLTYNFVADTASQKSTVRVDFSFSALSTAGAGDDYIGVALGQYSTAKTLNASANRYLDLRLYNDGTVDFRTSQSNPRSLNNTLLAGANTISIFANDYDAQSVIYQGLDGSDYVLAANSVAYWLNGSLVIMNGGEEYTWLDLGDSTAGGTVGTTENNFGKFGFNTTTADVGLDYVIDDIVISDIIPEPATLGILGLASMGIIFIRRLMM